MPSANDAAAELIDAGMRVLSGGAVEKDELEPCDYLNANGCLFPDDLRPFECARYICPFLKKEITPGDMREIRTLLHKLGVLHRELMEAIKPGRRS